MSENLVLHSGVERLPLLPLRDVVVSPYMVVPLFVGRSKSVSALEAAASAGNKRVLLVAQRVASKDSPEPEDLYKVGCDASILQMLKLPDGTVKVLAEGQNRARVLKVYDEDGYLSADIELIHSEEPEVMDSELEALRRTLLGQFEQYVKLNKKIPSEVLSALLEISNLNRLTDSMVGHLPLSLESKQAILEIIDVQERTHDLSSRLEVEIDILQVEKRIRGRVKRQMEKSQREYYLNEQVKAIQRELGDGEGSADLDELEKKIKSCRMNKEAEAKGLSELKKLRLMSPMSAEATVVRNYIDVLVGLPWRQKTKVSRDLSQAQSVLDAEHWGLEKVKERILEYLAVEQRVDRMKAPVLCLVGPPGVGKTSLAKSIAEATNRKFSRIALGGVRDEAEIRGHRRTYIGSMPGKILQNLSKAKVRNPLFLLDEIDKIGMDFRGDPASALLEVLDPEQNDRFVDHYLEVEYDLSNVLFIATANSLNIPHALLDRMEVVRLSGYTEGEKISIASKYLIPKQIKNNGLKKGEISISDTVVRDIIRYYTREAGVRGLEREINKICRKVVKQLLLDANTQKIAVTGRNLGKYSGVRRYDFGMAEKEDQIGQVTGLAWTEVGGELLSIEAVLLPGKGNNIRTGKLGEVMQESMQAALSAVKVRASALNIDANFHKKHDIHIHIPEGATPKDGPSAGIAICVALVSVLTKIPVRCSIAMTGEITLRGQVLPIGGLKEKLLAALRGGIDKVLIPSENVKDLAEVPDVVKNKLEIVPVKWIEQVFEHALQFLPAVPKDPEAADSPPEVPSSDSNPSAQGLVKH